MEDNKPTNSNNTGMIVAIVIAAVLIIGGIIWWASSSSEDNDTASNESSQQEEQQEELPNIVELASDTPELSTLTTAIVEAGLVDTLSGDGPFTVFAPTNDAFAALPDGTLATLLLPENNDQLVGVLTYHVVAGEAFAKDLSDGQVIETVQGDSVVVGIADDGTVTINSAEVILADVEASNGVVHVIDAVLIP